MSQVRPENVPRFLLGFSIGFGLMGLILLGGAIRSKLLGSASES